VSQILSWVLVPFRIHLSSVSVLDLVGEYISVFIVFLHIRNTLAVARQCMGGGGAFNTAQPQEQMKYRLEFPVTRHTTEISLVSVTCFIRLINKSKDLEKGATLRPTETILFKKKYVFLRLMCFFHFSSVLPPPLFSLYR
jgi:hypothetical protein